MDTQTYGVYEAARELGCSSQWIRVLLAERRLDGARKVDGQWHIPKAALEALKKRREPVSVRNLYEEASRKVDAMTATQKQLGVSDPELEQLDGEITARLAPDFRVTRDSEGELLIEPTTTTAPRLDNLQALQRIGKETK